MTRSSDLAATADSDVGLRLGLHLGYWGASPDPRMLELARTADDHGFDSIWVSESWGSDAFAVAAWLAGQTTSVRIGTSIAQMAGRTPVSTAMAAMTIDHLSNGRFVLGLGASGPQVVEGWYGQPFRRPLARTREYITIIRSVLARERPLEFDGEFYQHPYVGPDSTHLGKPLSIMTHPLRTDLPIVLGATGPKNVALATEIADGWLPIYYSPYRPEMFDASIAEAPPDFEVNVTVSFELTKHVSAALRTVKEGLALYVGGMGARGTNFHHDAMVRLGYGEAADRVQELFLAGRRDEAIDAVPDDFADEISLIGTRKRLAKKLDVWRESRVTSVLVLPRPADELRTLAELVRD